MSGWVKIWRKIDQWEWAGDIYMWGVFTHMIIKASHNDHMWRGRMLAPGQFPFGYAKFATEIGISIKRLRTCINRLEEANAISRISTQQGSVITILNWERYQGGTSEGADEGQIKGCESGSQRELQRELRKVHNQEDKKKRSKEYINNMSVTGGKKEEKGFLTKDDIQKLLPGLDELYYPTALKIKKKYLESLLKNTRSFDVEKKICDLQNYCESKGKRYKNYGAALNNFIKQGKACGEITEWYPNGEPKTVIDVFAGQKANSIFTQFSEEEQRFTTG